MKEEIEHIFKTQKTHLHEFSNTNAKDRIKLIKRFHKFFMAHREEIKNALHQDFEKSGFEVDLTEIFTISTEFKQVIRNLEQWMRPKKVETPLAFTGAQSKIHFEAKGVVLIISPWNFPFTLTFRPLISALAAGNSVIIKPSEITTNSSALMVKMIKEFFDETHVSIFEGGVDVSQALLSLPFHHIFFTGSPRVGKIVMSAAAKNLSSVTLELGGKSPVIVDSSANLKLTAKRLVQGKFVNNGQICIAPDHVYVEENIKSKFIDELKSALTKAYGVQLNKNSDYNCIVNDANFERLVGLLNDAIEKGAQVESGGNTEAHQRYISPTLLTEINKDMEIMKEEIFGPLLPILSFTNLEDVIQQINSQEKPLALYVYSKNHKNISEIVNKTRAGGTCINHNGLQFYNPELPFGGSNHSGIGKSHGHYGFIEFSNERSVMNQKFRGPVDLLAAPYTRFKQRIIDFTIKYL